MILYYHFFVLICLLLLIALLLNEQQGRGIPNSIQIAHQEEEEEEEENLFSSQLSQGTLEQLTTQRMLYDDDQKEYLSTDIKETIKRYLKTVYRNVKFLSDSPATFHEPDFIRHGKKDGDGEVVNIQSVSICNFLLEQMGKMI